MDNDDALRTILDQLDCKSAINLCQSNPNLERFCRANLQPSLQANFAKQGLISNSLSSSRLTCQIQNQSYPTITGYDNILYYLVDNKVYKIDLPPGPNEDILINNSIDAKDIIQIMFHQNSLYAIDSHGRLFILLDNKFKSRKNPNNIIKLLRNDNFMFITANGNTYNSKQQLKYKGVIDVQGNFILKHGTVYLGDEMILSGVKAISIGKGHRLILTNDNKVYCWGNNKYGQLGLDNQEDQYTLTLIPSLNNIVQILAAKEISLFLDKNRDLYHCGRNLEDIITVPTKIASNVIELYNCQNYPPFSENVNVKQLGYEDNNYFNYQIARMADNNLLVLIGEVFYPIKIF